MNLTIIAVIGEEKNVVIDHLKTTYGFQILSFQYPIRKICKELFTEEQMTTKTPNTFWNISSEDAMSQIRKCMSIELCPFTDICVKLLERKLQEFIKNGFYKFVISDLSTLPCEREFLNKYNGKLWKVGSCIDIHNPDVLLSTVNTTNHVDNIMTKDIKDIVINLKKRVREIYQGKDDEDGDESIITIAKNRNTNITPFENDDEVDLKEVTDNNKFHMWIGKDRFQFETD